ncbi:sensor histidine kinase [Microcoleus vaginatus DQ-U2]|uniref:sensor histidine kinase n=1 Tax=Microcoleus vaginatus TaxID=119532 RepID=UPI001685C8C9|nr:sensor histidine kinase [Microcoleus sp. FACHB-DQ6]
MIDFSQALQDQIDIITENWIEAVRDDDKIDTAKQLTYDSVRDSLPIVLHAIVTMLSESEDSDLRTVIQESLDHGTVRAQQGYDAEEIAREYRLLRRVIFDALEPELLKGSAAEVNRAYRLIDTALDEAIADCFQTYTQARFQELQEMQNQLQLTNQELTRLLRTSQESISHLAHELKTPLTSIIGYSELFLRQINNPRVKDSAPNLAHIDKVLSNGRLLLRLINDTLEISRYDTGRIKLQLTATNVRSAIGTVVEIIEPLAQAKNLEIAVDCDPVLDQVMTDYLRLQQIISNLVSNAIRYTQAGTITIKTELLPDQHWSICITDTGIGIASEDCDRIFQPFFRINNSLGSVMPDSTGLGLAIVARLVNLLQGKIELVSEVGVGSSFTVIFPLELDGV